MYDKREIVEQKLKELRDQIEKMEKENAELFYNLGIGPHQLEEMLNDPAMHSKEAYDFIQRERKALDDILENRLRESRKELESQKPRQAIGGHWILMR